MAKASPLEVSCPPWGQAFSRHLAEGHSLSASRAVGQMWSRMDVKPISRAHLAKAYVSSQPWASGKPPAPATSFLSSLLPTSCLPYRSRFLCPSPKYWCLGQPYPEFSIRCKLEARVKSSLSLT